MASLHLIYMYLLCLYFPSLADHMLTVFAELLLGYVEVFICGPFALWFPFCIFFCHAKIKEEIGYEEKMRCELKK